MQERELVKVVSDNPAHPDGYYIQFRDRMKPGDVEYLEPGDSPMEPIKQKKKVKI